MLRFLNSPGDLIKFSSMIDQDAFASLLSHHNPDQFTEVFINNLDLKNLVYLFIKLRKNKNIPQNYKLLLNIELKIKEQREISITQLYETMDYLRKFPDCTGDEVLSLLSDGLIPFSFQGKQVKEYRAFFDEYCFSGDLIIASLLKNKHVANCFREFFQLSFNCHRNDPVHLTRLFNHRAKFPIDFEYDLPFYLLLKDHLFSPDRPLITKMDILHTFIFRLFDNHQEYLGCVSGSQFIRDCKGLFLDENGSGLIKNVDDLILVLSWLGEFSRINFLCHDSLRLFNFNNNHAILKNLF